MKYLSFYSEFYSVVLPQNTSKNGADKKRQCVNFHYVYCHIIDCNSKHVVNRSFLAYKCITLAQHFKTKHNSKNGSY